MSQKVDLFALLGASQNGFLLTYHLLNTLRNLTRFAISRRLQNNVKSSHAPMAKI
jgi:hypothetical protein